MDHLKDVFNHLHVDIDVQVTEILILANAKKNFTLRYCSCF